MADDVHPAASRRFATIAKAAAYLDCSKRGIQQMVRDGRLTAYQCNSRLVRIDLNEIDRLMQPRDGNDLGGDRVPLSRDAHRHRVPPRAGAA
jgi:excisionase family DNA binding protein